MPTLAELTHEIQNAVDRQDRITARRLARNLLQTHATSVHGWLWMAWLSEHPTDALFYARRAAEIDPHTAESALQWAFSQVDAQPDFASPVAAEPLYVPQKRRRGAPARMALQGIALFSVGIIAAFLTTAWRQVGATTIADNRASGHYANIPINADRPHDSYVFSDDTPTATATALPTATATPSPTPTLEPSPAPTLVVDEQAAIAAQGELPPPMVATATPFPVDTRSLLFPVWPNRFETVIYQVKAGDNVDSIAARVGLSPYTLIWANDEGLTNPALLTIGQELEIPPLDGVLHTVKPGDTLEGLAARYRVDIGVIRWFKGNDLEGTNGVLVPGQQIMVPGGVKPIEETPPPPAAPAIRGGASYFGWPTTGVITQSFGSYHNGIDIANSMRTSIFASQSGEVVYAGWNDTGYGYMILIDHHNGWKTRYAHLSGMYPSVGDWVERGDLIALMGSTGRSTGPHLHFEIISRGYSYNPFTYLPR